MMTDKMELEQILKAHSGKYPLMQPTDAVKLIYQNEFGGGHLIRDTEACLNYLRREYASVESKEAAPFCETIGNGIVRVFLTGVNPEEIETLGAAFIRSAGEHKGNLDSFLEKLDVLKKCTAEGIFSFDVGELDAYLEEYAKAGYPAVSHSPQYRQAYQPAYRVILEKYSWK